jgi:hypothetical protein
LFISDNLITFSINYFCTKGLVDKEEFKKRLGKNYDENKFNQADLDKDGRVSFKGKKRH